MASLVLSIIILLGLSFRINRSAFVFVLIFLSAHFLGFVKAIFTGTLDLFSGLNMLSSLIIFIVLSTYIIELLARDPNRLSVVIDRVLFLYFFLSIFEILNYETVLNLRNVIHGGQLDEHNLRDIILYGLPRPTGLFSEASNFGRVIGLLITLHAFSGNSKTRSIAWFIVFTILIRSPMIMYAAPLLLLGLMINLGQGKNSSPKYISVKVIWSIVGSLIVISVFLYSQIDRIFSMLIGNDGSFFGRIGLPFIYLFTVWQDQLIGSGPTPLNEVDAFVNNKWLDGRSWLMGEDFRIAVAPSIITVISMGLLGMIIFVGLTSYYLGGGWVLIFFYCNFLANGVNGPSMFVPLAVMFGMYISSKQSKAIKSGEMALSAQ